MERSIVITGAGSGIGLAAVRRFTEAGWRVTAIVRSAERASELKAVLDNEGMTASTAAFDLGDRTATDEGIAQILAGGVPDVIVNNAGVAPFGPIELVEDATIDMTFETNIVAPLRIIRAFIPHFRRRGNGVFINISSGLGFASDIGQGVYAASKHALEALSEALYYEMRPFGVRVAVIEPGLTNTSIRDKGTITPGYGPDSAYWGPITQRHELLGSTLYKDGWQEDAAVVAEAIYDAANNPAAPLFTPVGKDTVLGARLRGRADLASYDERSERELQEWRTSS